MLSNNRNGNNHLEEKLQRFLKSANLRVVDLFSGCGGLSLGFQRAGYKILGGVECDQKAARTHALNFFKGLSEEDLEIHASPVDITDTSPEQFMIKVLHAESPDNLLDIIIGGPPCQAFARIGRAKLRQVAEHSEAYLNDDRANLYLHFLKYVDFFRPLAVLIENVPDILNYGGKNVAEEITSSLEDLGYSVRYTLLNAVNYGVPQFRLRFFLIAYLGGLNLSPEFPEPTHQTHIPTGYTWEKTVALKHLQPNQKDFYNNQIRYIQPPRVSDNLPEAVTAGQALADLPALTDHLKESKKHGARKFDQQLSYRRGRPGIYAMMMRTWPGFEASKGVVDHVIRFLPRDYEIFRQMKIDDQYPEAHIIAMKILEARREEIEANTGLEIAENSPEYRALKKQFLPPYSVDKFPNKWWKINPDMPVRTLTAHIGKDTYTHIHYDSEQARVISVRDAARLQSFPDGFVFAGAMNDAYRQIGNSVPPLMAFALAKKILTQIQKIASQLPTEVLDRAEINNAGQ
ncbi:MAG: DNA cytosine methyltransferase [Chloroflexota bacterium]